MTLDDCESIFNQALTASSELEFCNFVEPLFKEYEILSLEFGRGSIFWRARLIENDIYPNLSELDYPPPEKAKQGRVNDCLVPCFYVAARKETALVEIGVKEGQLVQIAGFRIKNTAPIRLAVIGEYSNVQKNGYMHFAGRDPDMVISKMINSMPRQEALKTIYIDKFFASVLADPDASSNNYIFSRALSKAIYSKISAEGIVYPSVKDRGGFNVAIQSEPSDKSFLNVCCLVVRIGKPRRFGMVEFTIERTAERLDNDWNFIWSEGGDPEILGMYNMTKEEFVNASRNPNDRNNLLYILQSRGS